MPLFAAPDRLKADLAAVRPLAPEQEQRVLQKFRLEWNYHSNAIEGNSLTLDRDKENNEEQQQAAAGRFGAAQPPRPAAEHRRERHQQQQQGAGAARAFSSPLDRVEACASRTIKSALQSPGSSLPEERGRARQG